MGRWGKYPSLVDPLHAANMVLYFAPETNGEVAYRGFQQRERETRSSVCRRGYLAEPYRGVRYDFLDNIMQQPRRILTSPCWSGIDNMTDGPIQRLFARTSSALCPGAR